MKRRVAFLANPCESTVAEIATRARRPERLGPALVKTHLFCRFFEDPNGIFKFCCPPAAVRQPSVAYFHCLANIPLHRSVPAHSNGSDQGAQRVQKGLPLASIP